MHSNSLWAHLDCALAGRAGAPPVGHRALRPRPPRDRAHACSPPPRRCRRRPSPSARPWPTASGPRGPSHVRIVPPVGRPRPVRPRARVSRTLRSHLTSDETAPLVGIVGRIDPEKGVDVLVRAMGLLHGAGGAGAPRRGGQRAASPPTAIPSGCGPRRSGRSGTASASSGAPTTSPARCAPSTSSSTRRWPSPSGSASSRPRPPGWPSSGPAPAASPTSSSTATTACSSRAATPTRWPRRSTASSPTTSCAPGSPSGDASPRRAGASRPVPTWWPRCTARPASRGAGHAAGGRVVRVLMVTKFVPLPDNDGGKQRALAVAVALAAARPMSCCAPTTTATATWPASSDSGIDVRSVPWRPTPGARRARGAADPQRLGGALLQPRARRRGAPGRRARAPSTCCRWSTCRWSPWRASVAATRTVLDLHNVESALVRSYARVGRGPEGLLAHAEAAALGAMERSLMPSFDTVVVVSERERHRLPAGRRRRARLPQRQGPRPVGPAAARVHPDGRLRRHHGLGAQRRRRPVVRAGGLARGAAPHPRCPAPARRAGPGPGGPGPGILIGGGFRYRFGRPPLPCPGASGGSSAAIRRRYPPEDPRGPGCGSPRRGHLGRRRRARGPDRGGRRGGGRRRRR